MRVLVTGATGFTGGHLARSLGQGGYRVQGLVRPASRDRAEPLAGAGVEVALGDLTDAGSLLPACSGIDVVYHIAAMYRTAGQRDAAYRAVNAVGTSALPGAVRRAGVARFVRCCTGGVHGHVEDPPANEDAPLAPGDVYQRSKLEVEKLARAAGARRPDGAFRSDRCGGRAGSAKRSACRSASSCRRTAGGSTSSPGAARSIRRARGASQVTPRRWISSRGFDAPRRGSGLRDGHEFQATQCRPRL